MGLWSHSSSPSALPSLAKSRQGVTQSSPTSAGSYPRGRDSAMSISVAPSRSGLQAAGARPPPRVPATRNRPGPHLKQEPTHVHTKNVRSKSERHPSPPTEKTAPRRGRQHSHRSIRAFSQPLRFRRCASGRALRLRRGPRGPAGSALGSPACSESLPSPSARPFRSVGEPPVIRSGASVRQPKNSKHCPSRTGGVWCGGSGSWLRSPARRAARSCRVRISSVSARATNGSSIGSTTPMRR
jgi:hypothetical protein